MAGKRAGLVEGTRSGLWGKFAEGISVLRPKYVVAENVRGLLSAKADSRMEPCPSCMGVHNPGGRKPAMRALGAVLGDLADLGYDAQWTTIRASDVGACHRRERVILLAVNQASEYTFGGDGREGFSDPRNQAARENGSDFSDTSDSRRDGSGSHRSSILENSDSVRSFWGDEPSGRLQAQRADHPTSESGGGSDRPGVPAAQEVNWGVYEPAIRRWEQVFGLPCPRPTRPIGPGGAERLSSEFVEWMMGLEPGWVTDPRIWEGFTDKKGKILEGRKHQLHAWRAQIKMLGNGVHPLQVSTALKQLLVADMMA